jgi:hypothetical protein
MILEFSSGQFRCDKAQPNRLLISTTLSALDYLRPADTVFWPPKSLPFLPPVVKAKSNRSLKTMLHPSMVRVASALRPCCKSLPMYLNFKLGFVPPASPMRWPSPATAPKFTFEPTFSNFNTSRNPIHPSLPVLDYIPDSSWIKLGGRPLLRTAGLVLHFYVLGFPTQNTPHFPNLQDKPLNIRYVIMSEKT